MEITQINELLAQEDFMLTSTTVNKITSVSFRNISLPSGVEANILKTLNQNSSLLCGNFHTFALDMRYNKIVPVFIVLVILIATAGCSTKPDLTGVPEVSYTNDIKRIMSANCNFEGCHGGGGHHEGALDTYEGVMSFGEINAGDAHASKLYRLITGRSGPKMPPSGYSDVSSTDIKTIYIWIEQGAKNN